MLTLLVMFIYGGSPGTSISLNDTWSYSYSTNTWTQLYTGPPTSRSEARAAFFVANRGSLLSTPGFLMYGGAQGLSFSSEVWQLSLNGTSRDLLSNPLFPGVVPVDFNSFPDPEKVNRF